MNLKRECKRWKRQKEKERKGKLREAWERENRRGGIASDDSRGQSLFTSPCRHLPLCKVSDAPARLWVFTLYALEFILVICYRLVKKKENKNK